MIRFMHGRSVAHVIVGIIGSGLAVAAPPAAAAADRPAAMPVPCPNGVAQSPWLVAECLRIENRDAIVTNPAQSLFVLRVRVKGARPGPVPVVLLHGGPGAPVLEFLTTALARATEADTQALLGQREWIAFDQRGIGRSTPTLSCPIGEEDAFTVKWATTCAGALQSRGIRLDQYNSIASASDIEGIRHALGYQKVALFGLSYGSRLAHSYIRLHPDRVAAAVHDGAMRPDNHETLDDAAGLSAAMHRIIMTREGRGGARLWRRLRAGLAALEKRPALVDGTTLTADRALAIVRDTAYGLGPKDFADTVVAARLIGDGDYTGLLALQADQQRMPIIGQDAAEGEFSVPQALSIDCNEEKSFEDPAALKRAARTGGPVIAAYITNVFRDRTFELCAAWPSGRAPAVENALISTAVPQLVLTGDFDLSLSSIAGAKMVRVNPNTREVRFAASGHVQFRQRTMRCAMRIAHRFLDDPKGAQDTRCAATAGYTDPPWIDWRPAAAIKPAS